MDDLSEGEQGRTGRLPGDMEAEPKFWHPSHGALIACGPHVHGRWSASSCTSELWKLGIPRAGQCA